MHHVKHDQQAEDVACKGSFSNEESQVPREHHVELVLSMQA